MKLKVENTGRQLSVNSPIMFFASDRELAEEAFAGDVIGIPNHGVLRVGDSLSESGTLRFAGLPNFAPGNPAAGAGEGPAEGQAPEEGAGGPGRGGRDPAVPARDRLGLHRRRGRASCSSRSWPTGWRAEYGLDVVFEAAPFAEARWLAGARADIEDFSGKHRTAMAEDIDGQPVFLAKSSLGDGLCRRAVSQGGVHEDQGTGIGILLRLREKVARASGSGEGRDSPPLKLPEAARRTPARPLIRPFGPPSPTRGEGRVASVAGHPQKNR